MLHLLAFVPIVLAPLAVPSPSQPIVGGDEVAACGWPSVVALDGTCSGTLIHPQVVLYAAHCTGKPEFVTPGEVEAEGTPIPAECDANPSWDHQAGGSDFAVCVLAEPIENVPIVPIVMGCELQALAPGVLATSVGFGLAPDGPAGIKRAVTYAIDEVSIEMGDVWVGGADGSLCDGDSGGGAFVQWTDGSWRLFGVHSAVAGTPCTDDKALLTLAAGAVPWIEEFTGFDVSPCHDADGTWNPGPDCGDLPMDPAAGGGAWPTCETGPLSGPSSACGAPSYGPDDVTAPTIAIASPQDGATFPSTGGSADVDVMLEASDADWGVDRTWLRVDGVDVPSTEDTFVPFEVPTLSLPDGTWELEAVARDWAGNEGVSAKVTIVVGDPPAPGDGGSTDEGGSEGGDATSDEAGSETGDEGDPPADDDGSGEASTTAAQGDEAGGGCGCRTRGRGAPWLVAALAGLVRKRRRSG